MPDDNSARAPDAHEFYRRHVEGGVSIRALAREAGLHASTVLRCIRRVEQSRDDPLVDEAMASDPAPLDPDMSVALLRRLTERGAQLLVDPALERAIIVRDGHLTMTLDRRIAGQLALAGWVRLAASRPLLRYAITPAGRRHLRALLDEAQPEDDDIDPVPHGTPLEALARRRAPNGQPWLGPALVHAGDRLRQDYEAALFEAATEDGPARGRVEAALADLGPDLADLARRVLCRFEGLEAAERRFGWPARSGKLALRLALGRLATFYGLTQGGADARAD